MKQKDRGWGPRSEVRVIQRSRFHIGYTVIPGYPLQSTCTSSPAIWSCLCEFTGMCAWTAHSRATDHTCNAANSRNYMLLEHEQEIAKCYWYKSRELFGKVEATRAVCTTGEDMINCLCRHYLYYDSQPSYSYN